MAEEPRKLMTVHVVADYLGVHPETVRRWLRDGRLIGIDLGSDSGGWRIAPADLETFIAARRGTRSKQEKGSPR
jgi:excisionase family DNA binding protein